MCAFIFFLQLPNPISSSNSTSHQQQVVVIQRRRWGTARVSFADLFRCSQGWWTDLSFRCSCCSLGWWPDLRFRFSWVAHFCFHRLHDALLGRSRVSSCLSLKGCSLQSSPGKNRWDSIVLKTNSLAWVSTESANSPVILGTKMDRAHPGVAGYCEILTSFSSNGVDQALRRAELDGYRWKWRLPSLVDRLEEWGTAQKISCVPVLCTLWRRLTRFFRSHSRQRRARIPNMCTPCNERNSQLYTRKLKTPFGSGRGGHPIALASLVAMATRYAKESITWTNLLLRSRRRTSTVYFTKTLLTRPP